MRSPIEGQYLFPAEGMDLTSDARRLYYKELVSFAREELISIPDGYLQHLKDLFFKGYITIDPWTAFRGRAPLLICLSALSVDRDFVIKTFGSYKSHCAYYDVELYEMRVLGRGRSEWPMVVERFDSVVEYLADDNSNWASSEGYELRSQYLSLYFSMFYLYKKGGDIKLGLTKSVVEYVERNFEAIKDLEASKDTLAAFPKAFSPIFSGKIAHPESAYFDPVLLGFLQRFFAKQLPPTLQGIAEGVYYQLEHPIKFVDGQVEY